MSRLKEDTAKELSILNGHTLGFHSTNPELEPPEATYSTEYHKTQDRHAQ